MSHETGVTPLVVQTFRSCFAVMLERSTFVFEAIERLNQNLSHEQTGIVRVTVLPQNRKKGRVCVRVAV